MKKLIVLSLLGIGLLFFPTLSLAKVIVTFQGEFDLTKGEMNVDLDFIEGGLINTTISHLSENNYNIHLNFDHFKTPLFDLSTQIDASLRWEAVDHQFEGRQDNMDIITGKLWSQYTLIDFQPARELSGQFRIEDHRLLLEDLFFGNLSVNGYMDLSAPHKIDLSLKFFSIPMDDFINFWTKKKKIDAAGEVAGLIRITGFLDQMKLQGNLESSNGHIKKLNFDSMHVRAEGIYPHLEVAQSNVAKSDGFSFNVEGPIDLSDHLNFKKQISALTLSPIIADMGTHTEWTIKSLGQEESGKTELKYLLRKGEKVGSLSEEGADLLGIERTLEF